ncbi:MAG: extracytoplasmic binding receptor [Noviherbaspirillum sp.]|nr:extracytoplasmic binding receptor [Noviherbaspirillum sp.]
MAARLKFLAAAVLALAACGASAQAFPSKTIRIIVPYPPGGTADALPRMIAEKLPAILGQQVIVENRPGAGGNVGAEMVARASPDGYTLLATPPHLLTINHLLYKISFDPGALKPISIIASYPNVLLASPKLPAKNLRELIALAHAKPQQLNFASQGNGTSTHLTAEMFKTMGKAEMVHIPYKGTAPAIADLTGGHVDVMFDNLITAMPFIKSGRLKLLGVGGNARVADFPDVPAISEVLPGFLSETWLGIVAPPNTPAPVVNRLSDAIAKVIHEPEFKKRMADVYAQAVGNTPAQMAEIIKADTERWSQVIRDANIKAD